jgi:Pyridoxamine 5'-phosphate oxidase
VASDWVDGMRTMLEAPSPAVLTTYRKDGSAAATPVWFRWHDGAFEMVIAVGDVKLQHLERRPECTFVVFETDYPFRGLEVRGVTPEIVETDVTQVRIDIAGRYLGGNAEGERYAAQRTKPGVLVRLRADAPRVWDLREMLPARP